MKAKKHLRTKSKAKGKSKRKRVTKAEVDRAEERIRERLDDARGVLDALGFDSRVRVHRYKDNSIDGELLVPVPRGTSAEDIAFEIEGASGRKAMPGFWLNMGVRFTIKEDEEVYRKMRGFNDVNTHYQRATPGNWSEIPLIVRKTIIGGMEKKYGRKTNDVYLRIHWSPDGDKPKTRG